MGAQAINIRLPVRPRGITQQVKQQADFGQGGLMRLVRDTLIETGFDQFSETRNQPMQCLLTRSTDQGIAALIVITFPTGQLLFQYLQ